MQVLRSVVIILSTFIISSADSKIYQIQLKALKSNKTRQTEADQTIKYAKSIGLTCHKEYGSGKYSGYIFIRCNSCDTKKELQPAIDIANKYHLDYFIIQPKRDFITSDTSYKIAKNSQNSTLQEIKNSLFGENRVFREIMNNEYLKVLDWFEKNKQIYLKEYQDEQAKSGLELTLDASRSLDDDRSGFKGRLSWNLLNDGYFGYKNDLRKKTLQQESDLDKIFDNSKANYIKIAKLEIDKIKRSIAYHFLQKRIGLLKKLTKKIKREVDAGSSLAIEYENIKRVYDENRFIASHMHNFKGKLFDKKYKKLVSHIEDQKLESPKSLFEYALKNDPSIKLQEKEIKEISILPSISDNLEASIYVDRNRYTFIDRDNSKLGVRVTIPLDSFKSKQSFEKIKVVALKNRLQSYKDLLKERIDMIYNDINSYKDQIALYKREIKSYKQRLKSLKLQASHPLSTNKINFNKEIALHNINIIKLHQKIWESRCDIIKNIIELQSASKAKLL